MKKKGFTLVELLAVIAILAILVIIALPNVLSMFRDAKKNTFKEEAQKIFQTAETTYISSAMGTSPVTCFDGTDGHKLDLTGRDINYYVKFDANGQVVAFEVSDSNYNVKLAETASTTYKVTNIGDTSHAIATGANSSMTKCPVAGAGA